MSEHLFLGFYILSLKDLFTMGVLINLNGMNFDGD